MNVKKRALRLSLNSSSSLVFTSRLFQVHKCEHSHNQSFIMYKFTFLDCVCVISVACDNVPTNKQVFFLCGFFPCLVIYRIARIFCLSNRLVWIHCVVCSDLQGTGGRRLCVTIEPALLLKGDIMVSSHGKEMTNRGPPTWVGLSS